MSFFSDGTGVCSQGLVLGKQALYYLSHTSSLFCSGNFEDVVLQTVHLGWL
jgi:hypothetical protein